MRSPLAWLTADAGGVGAQDLELVVERELLGERVAQVLVVVDDEKPVRVRHRTPCSLRGRNERLRF